jgi:ArsR family transcriptional regulator
MILDWLRDPERHFPPQRDGDLVLDGVCSLFYQRDENRIAEVKELLSGDW